MAWTEEMIQSLKDMWKQGLTTNEIAKNLGVSKNSIVGKVHRLNLTARPSPIKKKEEIAAEQAAAAAAAAEQAEKSSAKFTRKITINTVEIKTSETEKKSNSRGVELTELDNHTCRWPLGDPREENFCFCGKRVRGGQTYCEEHSAIAYVKPIKKG